MTATTATTTSRDPWRIAAVALLPILVLGLLLAALWNPQDRLDQVPAAIVNLDEPVEQDGQTVPLGRQLAAGLVSGGDTADDDATVSAAGTDGSTTNFDWTITDADGASAGLADGTYAAVVTIPENFSAAATSFGGDPSEARQATIDVATPPGGRVADDAIARVVASTATGIMSSSLTETYVDNVLVGFSDLADGIGEAQDGATQLADGADDAAGGADQLADGAGQLADGADDAAGGASQLSGGASDLASGATAAAGGATALSGGAADLASGAQSAASGAQGVASGAAGLADGASRLAGGASDLADGAGQVADGASQVAGGVKESATGATKLAKAADKTAGGTSDLADGAHDLSDGLAELRRESAPVPDALRGSADGVADLVGGIGQYVDEMSTAYGCNADLTEPAQCRTLLPLVTMQTDAAPLVDGLDELAGQPSTDDGPTGLYGLQAGIAGSAAGAADLAGGADDLADGTSQLAGGAHDLADGLGALRGGATQVAGGADGVASGADELASGASDLSAGANQLASGASDLSSGVGQLGTGATQLASGASDLSSGVGQLGTGATQLASGADDLSSGVGQLATGTEDLASGAGDLADGVDQLAGGADDLSGGLGEATEQIPTYTDSERQNLASVVAQPVSGPSADSLSTGVSGPLFAVVALWLGALGLLTVFPPVAARALGSTHGSVRLALSAFALPAVVAAVTGAAVGGILAGVEGLGAGGWAGAIGVGALISVAFVAVHQGFVGLLGNVGRGISLLIAVLIIATGVIATVPAVLQSTVDLLPVGAARDALVAVVVPGVGGLGAALAALVLWGLAGLALAAWVTVRHRRVAVRRLVPA
ncbi:YhgE/Pip family protein [Isoptericola sp. BMS4]|uniref:YhgE/Pip family protein n=1 Tax=Isoptericola sp. BMS4 TaxID=2527875 RepID=UPI00141ECD2D|nr:YhgE/Pip family protein [Isoptericola sp. BMS4]